MVRSGQHHKRKQLRARRNIRLRIGRGLLALHLHLYSSNLVRTVQIIGRGLPSRLPKKTFIYGYELPVFSVVQAYDTGAVVLLACERL